MRAPEQCRQWSMTLLPEIQRDVSTEDQQAHLLSSLSDCGIHCFSIPFCVNDKTGSTQRWHTMYISPHCQSPADVGGGHFLVLMAVSWLVFLSSNPIRDNMLIKYNVLLVFIWLPFWFSVFNQQFKHIVMREKPWRNHCRWHLLNYTVLQGCGVWPGICRALGQGVNQKITFFWGRY